MTRRLFTSALILSAALAACSASPAGAPATPVATDLSAMRTYLLDKATELSRATAALSGSSAAYHDLIAAHEFDYAAAWDEQPEEVARLVNDMRQAWIDASPRYEQIEGIVAGVPSLAAFDVILDAGASGAEDPEGAAPYDLVLDDGRVFERPGNLFGVTESTLWGTWPAFRADVRADLDGDGTYEFGETSLPDAGVILAAAESMDATVAELQASAAAWEPTESDAFTALVVMVPTMSEYFESWKNSRFIAGEQSQQRDFVVISRLSDIVDILGSLQVVFAAVEPRMIALDPAQSHQVQNGLAELRAFVSDVHAQERAGRQFTPEEADLLGAEAQDRATAIAGQVAQLAGRLGVELAE